MAICPKCNKHYHELDDEQGDHSCYYCGYYYLDDEDEDEEDIENLN